MSVTIKQNTIGFRDENGDFHYANTIGEKPTSEYINQIKEQGKSTLATIPTDYTSLYNEVQGISDSVLSSSNFTYINGFINHESKNINDKDFYDNSSTVYPDGGPYILPRDNYAYPDIVVGIEMYVQTAGKISYGIIKGTSTSKTYINSDIVEKHSVNVSSTGKQIVYIPYMYIPSDCSFFISSPGDTGKYYYNLLSNNGVYLYEHGFSIINSGFTKGSLGINLIGKSKNDGYEIYKPFLSEYTTIIYHSYNENNTFDVGYGSSPYCMNLEFPCLITEIELNVTKAGTLSIGYAITNDDEIKSNGCRNKIVFTNKIKIASTGKQRVKLSNPFFINTTVNRKLVVGCLSDTLGFYFGKTGKDIGFIDSHGTPGNETNTIGINIYGKKIINNFFMNKYVGKKFSILGDSISTYRNYIPNNSYSYYPQGEINDVTYTWWYQLINELGGTILVNNSYSGSQVSNLKDSNNSAIIRCEELGSNDINPDVIIVYMGINDFDSEVPIGTYNGKSVVPTDTSTFRSAYGVMLNKILTKYKSAEVWVCTLPPAEQNGNKVFPEINDNNIPLKDFNDAIEELATAFNVHVLHHDRCGITYHNMGSYYIDGTLHPNIKGHDLIAKNDIREMLSSNS